MAGIYIHIPFCKQACHYCNFHFSIGNAYSERMIEAICKEIEWRKNEIDEKIDTIYFGGGTPSILDPSQIDRLLNQIHKDFSLGEQPEITLEANPDDIDPKKANRWKTIGINRYSIGIQSFSDLQLQWMNRAHNAAQALHCIEIIREAGFENFSIDLIYGSPNQNMKDWKEDLEKAIQLQIPHLSCYALTVEQETPLFHMIKKGKKQNVNSDLQADMFKQLIALSRSGGYHHYEISNFAVPGMESKHNSAYWKGLAYLGFGPSAHSHHQHTRSWNISNNMAYMQSIENNILPSEKEELSAANRLNEYIMTRLRMSSGIEEQHIQSHWGVDESLRIEQAIAPFILQGKIEKTAIGWKLTDDGKYFADGIAADLFIV